MENWFGRKALARFGLFAAAIAIMLFILPRADHTSYNYELNQPWKYPLLTAEYDLRVYPDSAASMVIRDSIDAQFVPFVKHLNKVQAENVAQLTKELKDSLPKEDIAELNNLLAYVYSRGVMAGDLNDQVKKIRKSQVRSANVKDTTVVAVKDASDMMSIAEAMDYIDSVYSATHTMADDTVPVHLSEYAASAVSSALDANYIIDTYNDQKYRNREFNEISAHFGYIKKGQRIVDKGELVNPQIYNNLESYLEVVNEKEESGMSQVFLDLGRLLILLTIMATLYMYLWHYRRAYYDNFVQLLALLTVITLFVVFAVLMFEFVPNGLSFVPFAAIPVVIMAFLDSRTAILSLVLTVLICSLIATFPFEFIMLEILVGIIAATTLSKLTRRSQLLITALVTFVVYSVVYVGIQFATEGSAASIQPRFFGYYAVNAVILSFAYVLILIVEKVFGFTSNVTLVELSDINNPLLRRLAREAPGTFQHSIQVSTLASEAAGAIGANTLLVRTGALYHDIGKLECPINFTENQHGYNPHAGLQPEESAQKIISHVACGIRLAKQNNLPKSIKDFIQEHHGSGIAKYFYFTEANEKGMENVDKSRYQYPGPNPQSKETAILMMADAVEAASRSLKEYTPESISNLVNKIIDGQVADGLFKEAPISFRDIDTIKKTFINRLSTIYHTRIAYPELKNETEPKA